MTTDLGHDLLRVWTYTAGAGLTVDHEVVLPKDSGPRHLVQRADGTVLVVTEYSIEVFAVGTDPESGHFEFVGRSPATAGGAKEGDSAAEIALSADGKRAYVGVRGSNRISVLDVDGAPEIVRPLMDCASGGDWPRHHLVREGWLHVAHERSHDVTTSRLDPDTGQPGEVQYRLITGSPTALVMAG
ncbi:lactonase family protein [Arthrobacter sp. D1-17]